MDTRGYRLSPLQQSKVQLISALAHVASEVPSLEQDRSQVMAYVIANVPEAHRYIFRQPQISGYLLLFQRLPL